MRIKPFEIILREPERGLYDNMKTAVDKVGRGNSVTSTGDSLPWLAIICTKRSSVIRHRAGRRVYADRLVVVAEAQVIAIHERAFSRERKAGSGKTIYDWRHYL